MGRRPKPRLEPSFGEGSKDSKNFTAKGTRRGGSWRHVLRFRVPFAVKLWNSWDFSGRRFQAGFGVAPQNLPLRFARFENWGWGGGVTWVRPPVSPSSVASRHLPHPGEGYCGSSVRFRDSVDFLAGGNFCQKVFFLEVAPTPSLPPGGEGGTPVPDEGEIGERTHVTHPANTNRQATIPRPGAQPCHPERSGTTHQKSRATTNHCRTANPAPSGAPAGGISIAKRYYMKQRNPRKSLPPGGEGGTPVPDEGETGERTA